MHFYAFLSDNKDTQFFRKIKLTAHPIGYPSVICFFKDLSHQYMEIVEHFYCRVVNDITSP